LYWLSDCFKTNFSMSLKSRLGSNDSVMVTQSVFCFILSTCTWVHRWTPAFLEALSCLLVGSPCVVVSCLLVICEFHFDLIFELNVASGNLVIYLLQFLEEPMIGRRLGSCWLQLLSSQPSDSWASAQFALWCFDPCRMPILYGLWVARLGKSDLLSAGPFLGSLIDILGTN
jgi:hypothetical protein